MKRLLRLVYTLGIRKSYRQIDRLHYLKRLARVKHEQDEWYYSEKDAAQYAGGEVLIASEFRGAPVMFLCRPDVHMERQIINRGLYGADVLSFLAMHAAAGEIICDVGANIGAYSIPLAKAFPGTEVHAFEPNPPIATRLRQNVLINGAANVHVHQLAVGDRTATMEFHAFEGKDHGMSSFIRPRGTAGESETIAVKVVPLDEVYDTERRRIGVLKIDVQGFEHQVMTGARKLIQRCRPFVAMEHEDSNFPDSLEADKAKKALQRFFQENDYDAYYLTRFDHALLFPVRWDKMLQGDLIAIPRDRRPRPS